MIEIIALGGYQEFGRNMTAVKVDDEVVILDMGIHLENYINLTEDEDLIKVSKKDLERVDAIPQLGKFEGLKNKTIAIIPTHAHLDHIGALPFLARGFKCPIYCTPFTSEVIKTIYEDEKLKLKNKIKVMQTNSTKKISDNITIEFISVAHSTPQTVMVAIHTKYGIVLYGNDFKADTKTVLGETPNIERIKELGKSGEVLALICDSTYSMDDKETKSENDAKDMLGAVLMGKDYEGKVILVSTFSSHLARLNAIVEFSKKIGRKVVFLGRSLWKYTHSGEEAGIVKFKDVEIFKYRKEINRKLKQIMLEGPDKYVLVVTGHQGEPKATLSRMANDETPLKLLNGDIVIFSSSVIPVESNIRNRELLEKSLKNQNVEIFRDIHVSGHAAKKDLRKLLEMVKAKHIIPAHGDLDMLKGVEKIAQELGQDKKNIHILLNGNSIKI